MNNKITSICPLLSKGKLNSWAPLRLVLLSWEMLSFILSFVFLGFVSTSCNPAYQGPKSDHFDGAEFYNTEPSGHSFGDMVKWLWEMETVNWPDWIEDPLLPAPLKSIDGDSVKITFINHATVLIQMNGVNILTDPIWSLRAGPYSWLGTKRIRAAGVKIEDLPLINFILISHDHYDHLDLQTLKSISKKHKPIILAGLGVKSILDNQRIINISELDWWQTYKTKNHDLKITFVPARHNSNRGLFSGNKTLWGGFVIEGQSGQIYFAGDTAFGEFIHPIADRFQNIRLAILPIGSYEKRWFMKNQHMNPDDAVQVHKILNAQQSMGIHYATFAEHPEQAVDAHEQDLAAALEKYGVPDSEFWLLDFGEGRFVKQIKPEINH